MSRKKGDLHPQLGEEVIACVLEGYIDHENEAGKTRELSPGIAPRPQGL